MITKKTIILSLPFLCLSFSKMVFLRSPNERQVDILVPNGMKCDDCEIKSKNHRCRGNLRTQPNDDLITFFQNLGQFFPENTCGSCGYVSLIQYLSYYDCFYNDTIIPDSYERNQGSVSTMSLARAVSPGVLRQSYNGSQADLYDHVLNTMSYDYQMYLMYIANVAMGHDRYSFDPSIGMWNYHYIINSIPAFANTSFSFTSYTDLGSNATPIDSNVVSWFDSYVKSELDDGNPVIIHTVEYDPITQNSSNYHSAVAYYYDDDGIHIHLGLGSGSSNADVLISNDAQIIQAGTIDFDNVLEIHSNNFIVNGVGYCGCGNHYHSYTDHYYYYSSNYHTAYCSCGASELRAHAIDFNSIYFNHGHSYGTCIDCGATIDLGGGIHIDPPLSNDTLVTDNGSYILPNGIYIIVEYDLESYLNGTLTFHLYGEVTE